MAAKVIPTRAVGGAPVEPGELVGLPSLTGRTLALNAFSPTKFPGGEYRITNTKDPSLRVACAAPICFVFFHTI